MRATSASGGKVAHLHAAADPLRLLPGEVLHCIAERVDLSGLLGRAGGAGVDAADPVSVRVAHVERHLPRCGAAPQPLVPEARSDHP